MLVSFCHEFYLSQMKNYFLPTQICHLLTLLVFVASCNGQNKSGSTTVQTAIPKEATNIAIFGANSSIEMDNNIRILNNEKTRKIICSVPDVCFSHLLWARPNKYIKR